MFDVNTKTRIGIIEALQMCCTGEVIKLQNKATVQLNLFRTANYKTENML
jgi:hypothetical protein